jgi:hypothetical protein
MVVGFTKYAHNQKIGKQNNIKVFGRSHTEEAKKAS